MEDESAKSMETLQSMGFSDTQQNEELLSKCGNDLNHVIEELYSVQDQGQVDGRRAEAVAAGGCVLVMDTPRYTLHYGAVHSINNPLSNT